MVNSRKLTIGCQIARGGYKEEELVVRDLSKSFMKNVIKCDYNECKRLGGRSKVDVVSNDMVFKAQVKKFKKGQFQQVDRHWVKDLIDVIPELENIAYILNEWCHIPLKKDSLEYVDKSVGRKLLDITYFKENELKLLLDSLNIHKRRILQYAFLGVNGYTEPDYLIGSEYINNIRSRICIWKIHDIIDFLEKENFEISHKKSVIKLGDAFSMQRKGGDGGRKSSNQLQMKIVLSNLNIHNVTYVNL